MKEQFDFLDTISMLDAEEAQEMLLDKFELSILESKNIYSQWRLFFMKKNSSNHDKEIKISCSEASKDQLLTNMKLEAKVESVKANCRYAATVLKKFIKDINKQNALTSDEIVKLEVISDFLKNQ